MQEDQVRLELDQGEAVLEQEIRVRLEVKVRMNVNARLGVEMRQGSKEAVG